jgi:hypothetical protein
MSTPDEAKKIKKLVAKPQYIIKEEEYTMPEELVLQIFSNLRKKDLQIVSVTCRQWHRLSQDHSLRWHSACTLVLFDDKDAYVALEGSSYQKVYFFFGI